MTSVQIQQIIEYANDLGMELDVEVTEHTICLRAYGHEDVIDIVFN